MERESNNFAVLKVDFIEKINLAHDIVDETAPIISKLPASPKHILHHEIARAYLDGIVSLLNASGYMTHYAAAARNIEIQDDSLVFGHVPTPHRLVGDFAEDVVGFGFVVRSQRLQMYSSPIGPGENILRVLELFDEIGKEFAKAYSLRQEVPGFASNLRLKRAESYFAGIRDTLKVILLDHSSGGTLNESIRNILEHQIPATQVKILLGEMRSYESL